MQSHGLAYQRLADALTAPLSQAIAAGVAARTIAAGDRARDASRTYDLVMAVSNRHLLAGTAPSPEELDHLVRFCLAALGATGEEPERPRRGEAVRAHAIS